MHTQELINNGMAWRLEGSFGRAAMSMIESGLAILGKEGNTDYYGNYVPSRYEVQDGTKGSLSYANRMLDTEYTEEDFDNGLVLDEQDESWD